MVYIKGILLSFIVLMVIVFLQSCLFPMNFVNYYILSLDEEKIIASDGSLGDRFGYSISMSVDGKAFVVGAPLDDDNGLDSGSVYFFQWNGINWVETKITPTDGSSEDYFGYSVSSAADGKTFVVGAYRDDDNGAESGSAYVFTWNGADWEEIKVTASDGGSGDRFGYSISMSADGKTFVVGSYRDDDNGAESGSAYVFIWNGIKWVETKITPADGSSEDRFGYSISLAADGKTFGVGAYDLKGSIYIFSLNGTDWIETKIVTSNTINENYLVVSISLSADGRTFVAGALDNSSGIIYIFNRNDSNWEETKVITCSSKFGRSVSLSIDGKNLITGAYEMKGNSGSVYVLIMNGQDWDMSYLYPSNGNHYDQFGFSVSLAGDGNTFIVGTLRDYDGGTITTDAGSVYVYTSKK